VAVLRLVTPTTVHVCPSRTSVSPASGTFAGPRGPFDVHNFRRREWNPAVDSSGIAKPARLYDPRSTFASNALAAGITVYELARIMGTSVTMIEAHYGALLDTAHSSLLDRLDAALVTG
jgi:hypothetical protein